MGTYLSTPILDKCTEEGDDFHSHTGSNSNDIKGPSLSWGVVDMQGWRKSMEDAHIAQTDVIPPQHFKPDPPSPPPTSDDDATLQNSAPMTTTPSPHSNADMSARVFAVFDGHGGAEVARFCQLYLVDVMTKQTEWTGEEADIGKALVNSFHALDILIDDPNRRVEITNLSSNKPDPSERRSIIDVIPSEPYRGDQDARTDIQKPPSIPPEDDTIMTDADTTATNSTSSTSDEEIDTSENNENDISMENNDDLSVTISSNNAPTSEDSNVVFLEVNSTRGGESDDTINNDDDSIEEMSSFGDDGASGSEVTGSTEVEVAAADGNMTGDESSSEKAEEGVAPALNLSSQDTLALFRKLLSMKMQGISGQAAAGLGLQAGGGEQQSIVMERDNNTEGGDTIDPSIIVPTKVMDGRLVCNLPDHPIHAGCTAICAVIVGKTLTVANAGDSRGVLYRAGGVTEPLSYDHKPADEVELNRIQKAGGFVNQFGRVNANLNLSRSVGDLKYKQVPGITPAEQIITAEPDIKKIVLADDDEFIILACDGIWDCLTNEQATEYVHKRIDTKTPVEIGKEMLNDIVSEDPKQTQGIGGDNMTVMIIDLLPLSRSYRRNPKPAEQQ